MDTTPRLQLKSIAKSFPGVKALDGVHLEVLPGEVHALLGENGAGKSTLIKIMAGAYTRDAGEILWDGAPVEMKSPLEAIRLGISVMYQEFNLVPALSVAENIFLGREPRTPLGLVDHRKMTADAKALLDQVGSPIPPTRAVERLRVAEQQCVEIAKALSLDAKVIVMDEPTAALTPHEVEHLFGIIRRLKARGVGIIYISHRLEEIFAVCDRITVLRDGKWVATAPVKEVDRPKLIQWMVGRSLEQEFPPRQAKIGDPLLEVSGLSRRGTFENVSFTVRAGEVVGMAGLIGSGRTEVARALFGADVRDAGTVKVRGREIDARHPREGVRAGIALVPEDRKGQGLLLEMPIRENITLTNLKQFTRTGLVSKKLERETTDRYIKELAIKTPTGEKKVRELSGGNQQKVVLAKWLLTGAEVFLFDEPTRGVDVGAKAEIYELMNRLAAEGKAILMISSELPEVLGMSDRILVMRQGAITGELPKDGATQEKIMALATGTSS